MARVRIHGNVYIYDADVRSGKEAADVNTKVSERPVHPCSRCISGNRQCGKQVLVDFLSWVEGSPTISILPFT